jgi:hypothetical protein
MLSNLDNPADPNSSNYQGYTTVTTSADIVPGAPSNGGTLSSTTLTISKVINATAYELVLATSSASLTTNPIFDETNYTSNFLGLSTAPLVKGTTYYWYARTEDSSGTWGPWSKDFSFTTSWSANAATPTFSPPGTIYSSDQNVTISCSTSSYSSIYYTTDGTTPTTSSAKYTGTAISVAGNGTVETIKAIATATGYATSGVGSATYTINYSATLYTLTPGTVTNGTMTPSTVTNVIAGSTTAITATPASGYVFAGWSASPSANATFGSATSASTTVTLTGNATITPTFSSTTVTYTLTPGTLTHGAMTPSTATTVNAGAATAITATPASGYLFSSWSANPATNAIFGSATSASTTVTLTGNATITAAFALIPLYSVTYSANGATGGTIPTDSNMYLLGSVVTVIGNTGGLSDTGYIFGGWNTKPNGTGTTYYSGNTLLMGSSNVILYALWSSANPPAGSINLSNPTLNINKNSAPSLNIAVNLNATDYTGGITAYYISESPTPPTSASTWQTVPTSMSFSKTVTYPALISQNTTRNFYVWFLDAAGNISQTTEGTLTIIPQGGITPNSIEGLIAWYQSAYGTLNTANPDCYDSFMQFCYVDGLYGTNMSNQNLSMGSYRYSGYGNVLLIQDQYGIISYQTLSGTSASTPITASYAELQTVLNQRGSSVTIQTLTSNNIVLDFGSEGAFSIYSPTGTKLQ